MVTYDLTGDGTETIQDKHLQDKDLQDEQE